MEYFVLQWVSLADPPAFSVNSVCTVRIFRCIEAASDHINNIFARFFSILYDMKRLLILLSGMTSTYSLQCCLSLGLWDYVAEEGGGGKVRRGMRARKKQTSRQRSAAWFGKGEVRDGRREGIVLGIAEIVKSGSADKPSILVLTVSVL